MPPIKSKKKTNPVSSLLCSALYTYSTLLYLGTLLLLFYSFTLRQVFVSPSPFPGHPDVDAGCGIRIWTGTQDPASSSGCVAFCAGLG